MQRAMRHLLLPTLAATLLIASAAQAAPTVEAAWSRPAGQAMTGVGFMTLANPGAKPDALVRVISPAAAQVQIHQSSMSGGMATMKAAPSVAIPARGTLSFAPGGYHLMFLNLKRAINVGDSLPATLVFASGARVPVNFAVSVSAPVPAHVHH